MFGIFPLFLKNRWLNVSFLGAFAGEGLIAELSVTNDKKEGESVVNPAKRSQAKDNARAKQSRASSLRLSLLARLD